VPQLSALPPPRRGARAGYYPDPLGGRHARWWDGRDWTLTVGPLVPADAPRSKALAPPTKVCPRCATQAETFAGDCPNCGRSYTRSSPWKIAAIAAGALLLTVGGCAGCVALVAQDAADEYSISRDEYRSLTPGTPQAAVESKLGEPYAEEQTARRTCLYYEDDEVFSDREFGVCFRGGLLVSRFEYANED
jgi:uncharacterized protein DUF2510